MNKPHTLSDFYRYLKLGIWTSGDIEKWGFVQKMDVYADGSTNKGCFVKKLPWEYRRSYTIIKKQLAIGLYLLDVYSLTSNESGQSTKHNYIVVISECRLNEAFEEQIYTLKVTNTKTISQFKETVINNIPTSRRWSSIKRQRRVSRFDASPINSITRKH